MIAWPPTLAPDVNNNKDEECLTLVKNGRTRHAVVAERGRKEHQALGWFRSSLFVAPFNVSASKSVLVCHA